MSPRAKAGALFAAALVLACTKGRPADDPDAAPGSFVVKTETLVLRHGPIGMGGQGGTYVLVDVENRTPEDRLISVDAMLRDPSGTELGQVGPDEMTVPKGATRTFALGRVGEAKTAVGAKVRVKVATIVYFVQPIVVEKVVTEGQTVKATVRNTNDRQGLANIIAGFHDAEGHILGRPWQRVDLKAGEVRELTFTAPAKTTQIDVYVGESLF